MNGGAYTGVVVISRSVWLGLIAVCASVLYLYCLSDSGLLGPDEPRYADIGRAMWMSGDFVTPRLFGEPWFEKPALLYWMIGIGFAAGLSDTLAPRLPVALLSLIFIGFYFVAISRLVSRKAGLASALILGTSVGWLGFSHAAVTDIPLSVFFTAGMLFAMPWALEGEKRWLPAAALCFGLASLAKGLVPLALAAPLLWFGRKRVIDWLRPVPVLAFLAVTLPWYVLCTVTNGAAFIDEFFLKHHVARFTSPDLQHVQPFWFYVPVLLGLLVPWTPATALVFRRELWSDARFRFFAIWLGWGFLFFSASTNKLPGYLLPLLPAAAAMFGIALERTPQMRSVLGLAALLSAVFALAAGVLPEALAGGIRQVDLSEVNWGWAVPTLLGGSIAVWLDASGHRRLALGTLLLVISLNVGVLKTTTFPVVDREVSARVLWLELEPRADRLCIENAHRAVEYGLRYYSHGRIPLCVDTPRPIHLVESDGRTRLTEVEEDPLGAPN